MFVLEVTVWSYRPLDFLIWILIFKNFTLDLKIYWYFVFFFLYFQADADEESVEEKDDEHKKDEL